MKILLRIFIFIICFSVTNTNMLQHISFKAYSKDLFYQEADKSFELFQSDLLSYTDYISQFRDASFPEKKITIKATSYSEISDKTAAKVLNNFNGQDGASLLLNPNVSITWNFIVAETGLYNIGFLYFPYEGSGISIQRDLKIDGNSPFKESAGLNFERIWINADGSKPNTDKKGNHLRSKQVEKPSWQFKLAMDSSGVISNPLYYYFEEGLHTLTLSGGREPFLISEIIIYQDKNPLSYQELQKDYKAKGYKSADKQIILEAEAADRKSDQTMYPIADRTSPSVSPYNYKLIYYNTIGGNQWKTAGQWIEWDLNVEKSGLYNIATHFKQNLKNNDISIRELYIDGKLPFKEAKNIYFKYGNSWQTSAFCDKNGERYVFYLDKGKHNLRLKVGLGDYSKVLAKIRQYIEELNGIYRKIVVVTGTEPDVYRDYQFDKLIPDVLKDIKELSHDLRNLEQEIKALNTMGGQSTAAIKRLYIQLEEMTKDEETIAYRLNTYKDNISSYGTWMNGFIEQPLDLDTLMLLPVGAKLPKGEANFFGLAKHYILQFLSSFISDYYSIGEIEPDSESNIKVWMSSGRDQAQILKQLINDTFTPEKRISVSLQLVNQGSLLPAVLAKIGPDVSLGLSQAEPLNYALRNAVNDLAIFEDSDNICQRFYKNALVPFRYEKSLYALPETQTFPMLFYRKDILKELDISLTELETWDNILMSVLPKLQKSSLMMGVVPNINTYLTYMYQQNGELYINNGKNSGLNTSIAVSAMRKMRDIYTQYRLPLAYDFANRFRTGEMPLAVVDFTSYNQLTVFAPEIKGLWGMMPVPGTRNEDGTVNHAVAGAVTGCIMLSQTKDQAASWEFMKWWTSIETQSLYGQEMESIIGSAARYNSANIKAFEQVQWDSDVRNSLAEQMKYVRAIPEVPGGYFTSRHFDFAFRDIVYEGEDIRETLNDAAFEIDREIENKLREFSLIS